MQKENFENLYSIERKRYYNDEGLSLQYILDKIAQNIDVESVFRRKVDIENQMLNENIENSRYNVKYKEILCDKLPRYPKKEKVEKSCRIERKRYYNDAGLSLQYILDKIAQNIDIESEVSKKGKSGKVMSVIARVRCGNFENANKYWLGEKKNYVIYAGKIREPLTKRPK
ncbi:hypothetical protein TSAR_007233 [Trichomalopsis sarcophagae]|uniref:Uncharacterized protein n=1 Tax=Trichomalopsis sarcophagae TaxID=543379 RepID=A0A232EJN6_9HYME|nr:hypothetical protein TSAR_007233 [Trichomalopsis sarcophagae]